MYLFWAGRVPAGKELVGRGELCGIQAVWAKDSVYHLKNSFLSFLAFIFESFYCVFTPSCLKEVRGKASLRKQILCVKPALRKHAPRDQEAPSPCNFSRFECEIKTSRTHTLKIRKAKNCSWQVKVMIGCSVDGLRCLAAVPALPVGGWMQQAPSLSLPFRYLWVLVTASQDEFFFLLLSDKAIISRRWETAFCSCNGLRKWVLWKCKSSWNVFLPVLTDSKAMGRKVEQGRRISTLAARELKVRRQAGQSGSV